MPEANPTPANDAEAIRGAKALLRNAVGLRRDARPEAHRRADDDARFDLVRAELLDRGALDRLACYLSGDPEPATLQLVAWLAAQGVEVWLPVLTDGADGLLPEPAWSRYVGPEQLRAGRRGILEPNGPVAGPAALTEAELIICPSLAADRAGRRLGRGGGWYDRVLASLTVDRPVWTLINDDELLDRVPTEDWDRPVTKIITPTRVIDCPADQGS